MAYIKVLKEFKFMKTILSYAILLACLSISVHAVAKPGYFLAQLLNGGHEEVISSLKLLLTGTDSSQIKLSSNVLNFTEKNLSHARAYQRLEEPLQNSPGLLIMGQALDLNPNKVIRLSETHSISLNQTTEVIAAFDFGRAPRGNSILQTSTVYGGHIVHLDIIIIKHVATTNDEELKHIEKGMQSLLDQTKELYKSSFNPALHNIQMRPEGDNLNLMFFKNSSHFSSQQSDELNTYIGQKISIDLSKLWNELASLTDTAPHSFEEFFYNAVRNYMIEIHKLYG